MLKGRRVGTFTAGITLIVFGVLFLLHSLNVRIDFEVIFKLWPIILILLGIEIIAAYIINKEEKLRYDGGAIALIIILAVFAMCMGVGQFVVESAHTFNGHLVIW